MAALVLAGAGALWLGFSQPTRVPVVADIVSGAAERGTVPQVEVAQGTNVVVREPQLSASSD